MQLVRDILERRRVSEGALSFDAGVELSGPFGQTRFLAHVDKTGAKATVTTTGAPWYVPRAFTSTLGDLSEVLQAFDLTYDRVEEDRGRQVFVIRGQHRRPGLTEARSGTVWIDAGLREVVRVHLQYAWGELDSRLEYAEYEERTVVVWQDTTISPLGLRLVTRYYNFRWPVDHDSPAGAHTAGVDVAMSFAYHGVERAAA